MHNVSQRKTERGHLGYKDIDPFDVCSVLTDSNSVTVTKRYNEHSVEALLCREVCSPNHYN